MSLLRPQKPKTGAEAVFAFLGTPAGRKLVTTNLSKASLSKELFDDLVAEACYAASRMDRRGQAIDSVEAWTNTALKRRSIDLLRGEVRQRRFVGRAAQEAAAHDRPSVRYAEVEQGAPAAFDEAMVQQQSIDLRRALCSGTIVLVGGQMRPWELSASLTYLGVRSGGLAAGEGRVPVRADVDGYRQSIHVSLWYAGQRDCFADEQGEDSANIRKRRSRRVQDVENVLSRFPSLIEGTSA